MNHEPLTHRSKRIIPVLFSVAILLFATTALAQDSNTLTEETLRNATYHEILEKTIPLTDGEFSGEPNTGDYITVSFIDSATGDLNGDGISDAAVVLAANTGGTGVFIHLAAVINQDGAPVNKATVMIGDRERIETIRIVDGQIIMTGIVHSAEDPFCCPSLAATLFYRLEDGELMAQTGLENSNWDLIAYGEPAAPQVVQPETEATLLFDTEQRTLNGSAGCNNYSSNFELDGSAITIAPVISTMMACQDPLMQLEQSFLATLEAAVSYSVSDGVLRIYSVDHILVFVPEAAPDSGPLIIMTTPDPNTALDASEPVHVAGIGRGLFEGNVVVQILDGMGNILIEQPTIANSEEMGGIGPWTIDLTLESVSEAAAGKITAYALSPADGSIMAEDHALVRFVLESDS